VQRRFGDEQRGLDGHEELFIEPRRSGGRDLERPWNRSGGCGCVGDRHGLDERNGQLTGSSWECESSLSDRESERTRERPSSVPVLLVHGIWDTAAHFASFRRGLEARGISAVHAVDLVPNDGRAGIAELGRLVAREAEALAQRESAEKIDIVGFSMGALIARWYVQRGGGKELVRRFVSISGPQHGTLAAHLLPHPGVRDMRPRSDLLRDLESDADPFATVEVHCLYTPFDLVILPPRSGVLAVARSVRAFPVAMHRFMIRDPAVLGYVTEVLQARAG